MKRQPRLETVRLLAAAEENDEAHKAQEARSHKYGIAIREGGHVTKPGEWSSVPDDEWLDPVNYSYPCPDAKQTDAAARYWGKSEDKDKYSSADQAKISARLKRMEEKFHVGEGKKDNVKGAKVRELSHEELRGRLQEKLPEHRIHEVHDDHVIAQKEGGPDDGDHYMFPWGTTGNGDDVIMGDGTKVERKWERCPAAASRVLAAADAEESPDYGYRWRVQIVEAGRDKQGIANYPLSVLHAAAPVYEGARVFALTQGQHDDPRRPYGKSTKDLVGWIAEVKRNATGLEGMLNILKSASWLRDGIADSFRRGKPDLYGLSHDVQAQVAAGSSSPKQVERIVKVDSVDIVYEPIAGGRILNLAAARAAGHKEAAMWETLLAALKATRPDLYKSIEAKVTDGTITAEEVVSLLSAGGGTNRATQGDLVMKDAEKILEQVKIAACAIALRDELGASKLPDYAVAKISAAFEGKLFETETLRAAIKAEKEYLDRIQGAAQVTGAGHVRIETEQPERVQAALDKMFGVETEDKFKDVKPLKGLRAAYVMFTGDENVSGNIGLMGPDVKNLNAAFGKFSGNAQLEQLTAAFSTSSFSFALGNTLYRRLIQSYKAVDYNEEALVSYKRNAVDFKTMESIRIGYFSDLPDVNPELLDYNEIQMIDDEESSYHLNQKGVILSVTRKAILNDDLRTMQAMVIRLGRAAKRTFARRLWNLLINNATYQPDGNAIFCANHNNLGNVALTNDATGIATLTAAMTQMYNQTEKDSGEVLALTPKWEFTPRALLEIGHALNQPWPMGGIFNPHAGQFGEKNEFIAAVPLFTDVYDYYLVADPNETELLEVAFLNGLENPELFVADNPLVGQMFVGDKIQYKMRHEYECIAVDYRGFWKAMPGGL